MGNESKQVTRTYLHHPAVHLAIVAVVLCSLAWPIISPLTFISSDVGLRYLQIRTLIAEGWQTLAIPYPVEIDPDFSYVPYYYAYSLVNGRLFLNISPFFPMMAAGLYQFIGMPGLVFAPIVGTLLAAWGTYKLVRVTAVPRPLVAMWAVVFATPLVFYSTLLWDHSLGTGIAIMGMAVLAQGMAQQDNRKTAVGGIILGLSLGQRPELYLFVLAVGIAWLCFNWRLRRLTAAAALGVLIGAVPIWILQTVWVGHPLGMATAPHLLGYGRPEVYPAAPFSGMSRRVIISFFLFYIRSRDPLTFGAAIAVLLGILLLFLGLRVPRYRKTAVLWGGVVLITAAFIAWGIVGQEEPVIGLLSSFPLFAFSAAYVNRKEKDNRHHTVYNFLFLTTFLYLGATLLVWPAFGGRMWGTRYMLTIYPLLIVLASYGLHHHAQTAKLAGAPKLTLVFIALLIVSVGYHAVGVRLNYAVISSLAPNRDVLSTMPVDAILTTDVYTSAYMTSVDNKTFFYIPADADLEPLFARMAAHQIQSFTLFPANSIDLSSQTDDGLITTTSENMYHLRESTD